MLLSAVVLLTDRLLQSGGILNTSIKFWILDGNEDGVVTGGDDVIGDGSPGGQQHKHETPDFSGASKP